MRILDLAIALGTVLLAQPGPRELFERARVLDESNQNLTEAIKLYSQVVDQARQQRALAAEAQFRLGLIYDRLGRKEEAQRAYRAVVTGYADQADVVRQARAKIAGPQPNGVVTRQVWAERLTDTTGGPSPDGRYLSFLDLETGDLAVRDLATGENRRVTKKGTWLESPEFALSSVPSPDGKQIAYAWMNKVRRTELRVIGIDGSEARVLGERLQPTDWSPDGKHILTADWRADRTGRIALVAAKDGSTRVLKTFDRAAPGRARFSPDGRYIAYDIPQREDARERDIFLLPVGGGSEIAVVQHPADDRYPEWTPDGAGILFASDRTGTMSAWVIRIVDGKPQGSPELVKHDMGRGFAPMGFTRKGSLYYGLPTGMVDVYVAEVDVGAGKVVVPPSPVNPRFVGSNHAAHWSPDGRQLAYLSRRGRVRTVRTGTICIRSTESGEERELTPLLDNMWWLRWSPDGRFLLAQASGVKGGIHRIDAQTGDFRLLVELRRNIGGLGPAAWSADGKAIFYARWDDDAKPVVRRDLETGQETTLFLQARSLVMNLALSRDGRQVAFAHREREAVVLKVMPASGGEARELVRGGEDIRTVTWTPDGLHLLFGRQKDPEPKTELWKVPAQGGDARPLGLTMPPISGLSVHPDGRRIAFTAGEEKSEVWVMENFLRPVQPRPQTVR